MYGTLSKRAIMAGGEATRWGFMNGGEVFACRCGADCPESPRGCIHGIYDVHHDFMDAIVGWRFIELTIDIIG